MTTKDNFARQLRQLVEAHEPFVAYWHPHGCGVMLTRPKRVKRQDPHSGARNSVTLSFTKELRRDYDRAMRRLRRSAYTFDVVSVEYDGEHIIAEGDLDL